MDKNYCEIHHLYYSGGVCPLCQAEKYKHMSCKYSDNQNVKPTAKAEDPTEDQILMLKKHFSGKW